MSGYKSKAERELENRKILAGSAKYITKNVVLNGESTSYKMIASLVQATIDAGDVCEGLRAKLAAAVKSAKVAQTNARTMRSALRNYVIGHFGESSPVLAEFGFKPRKVAQKTVAEKFETVEKALATRAARHTMGSRQKASVHGDITPPPAATGLTNGLS
ncbi:MAG TPA: hypothetical protein VGH87_27010 [Polyangiaceae bacterium]